ncbi:hypothetical protein DFH09DRAFT_1093876 [Mycena vulgaris]|nr:hypothetical protein DFH09DRAFT_1093876 [Mycena vulgaris]
MALRHPYSDFGNLGFQSLPIPVSLISRTWSCSMDWKTTTTTPRTHLSVDTFRVLPICPYLLEECKSLRALFVLGSSPRSSTGKFEVLAVDPRSVGMSLDTYCQDWQRGTLHGVDYWAHADAFIAKRMSSEVDREWAQNSLCVTILIV